VQPSPTRPAPVVAQPQQSTKPPVATNPQQTPGASLPPLPGDPLFPSDLGSVAPGTPLPQGDTLNTPLAVVVGADGKQTPRLASETPLDKGPIGLLAIIATVCVVGVTTGAIRAIITQRGQSSRVRLA
jgi:hypothetical protein